MSGIPSSPSLSRSALFVSAVAAAALVHSVTAKVTAPPVTEAVSTKSSAAKKRARPEVVDSTSRKWVVSDFFIGGAYCHHDDCEDDSDDHKLILPFHQRRVIIAKMTDGEKNARRFLIQKQLEELRKKYDYDTFREGPRGQLQAMRGKRWYRICHHNKTHQCNPCDRERKMAQGEHIVVEEPWLNPDIEDLRKRFYPREFRIGPKSGRPQSLSGGEWKDVCGHGRHPYVCRPCDGRALCKEHDVHLCAQCDRSLYCDCKRLRYYCPKHGGSSVCKKTGKKKQCCPCCKGSKVCPQCNERIIVADGTCIRCHTDFTEFKGHCSLAACRFMDYFERHFQIKLQHHHFDEFEQKWIGTEHPIKGWPNKSVDGYNADENLVVEYLGDDVHGYPPLWENDPEKVDRNGFRLEARYGETSEKMSKLKSLGYRVLYVWSADIDRKTNKSYLKGVVREFTNHLEW